MIEMLSIDLSNSCSKGCQFCYNSSSRHGDTVWTSDEVITFASDCIHNGVKAISLGGGEPLEYDGLFDIIEVLNKLAFVSVTTNGLLLDNDKIWNELIRHAPDKLHISIHFPENANETDRVIRQVKRLKESSIIPGVNLVVSADNLEACHQTYKRLRRIIEPKAIILVPLRKQGEKTTPQMFQSVTEGETFQSTACLLGCKASANFVSVSWDKKAARCSFTPSRAKLKELSFKGLIQAIQSVGLEPCES